MSKPIRIQRSRQHKQVSPNGLEIVYVGRPTKWGNPFKVGRYFIPTDEIILNPFNPKSENCKDIDQCLKLYTEHLERELKYKRLNIDELKGKNLSCWCSLSEKCHADVLLKIANEE